MNLIFFHINFSIILKQVRVIFLLRNHCLNFAMWIGSEKRAAIVVLREYEKSIIAVYQGAQKIAAVVIITECKNYGSDIRGRE